MSQLDSGAVAKSRVAIIGGGVCGLACAVSLQQAGFEVQVFEATTAYGQVGAGIGLGPNAVRALEAMGILEPLLQRLPQGNHFVKCFLFYCGLGDHQLVYDYPAAPELPNVSMQRAAFLEALSSQLLDLHRINFGKRCMSVTESSTNSGALNIYFTDGTTHIADVVLGADGIKSTIRNFIVNSGASMGGAAVQRSRRAVFSNTVYYRGMVPYSALLAAGFKTPMSDRPACFVGPNKHIVFIAIKPRDLVMVSASSTNYNVPLGTESLPEESTWVDDVPRDELQKDFDGWGPDVSILLGLMPEKVSRWSLHVVHPPLENYTRGRVALLGDAAHGMLPHLGAGAGQGLEDALLLVRLLKRPETNRDNLPAVLQTYSDVRRPRAQAVWEVSDRAGRVYDFHGPHGSTPEGLREDLEDICAPIWHYDLDRDLESAIEMLRANGSFAH
ncbi:FAD/NAD-P-binding domain-containing protein [Lentinus tigrinus ALCF2SS1-7]|uniref:FAD/NAD-P-binding domain-containing protein n=1 Tax=Lentinus tigrinus ALCF2SS1-7 TaxID=1328758 RepID=UPI0011663197|nr:FAD/NAD-P-binding domain-containing protein [Lentinus tigrinus ALCF2SS1-7]